MEPESDVLGPGELAPEDREAAARLLERYVRSDRGSLELVKEDGGFKEWFRKERYGLRPRATSSPR